MASQVPAGWYEDPGAIGGQRYWDGVRWTEQTRPAGAVLGSSPGPEAKSVGGSGPEPQSAAGGGRRRGVLIAGGAGVLVVALAVAAVVLADGFGDEGGDVPPPATAKESDPESATPSGDGPLEDGATAESTDDDAVGDDAGNAADDDADVPADSDVAAELDLVTDGTLTVCSEVPYAPFEFEDADASSGYSGFDIDLMQEFADRNGLELVVVNTDFAGLTTGAEMAAGTCDVAASAITITQERAAIVDFTEPYYSSDSGEDYGFVMVQDREDSLVALLNDTLSAMRADGFYDELFDSYFGDA